VLVGLLLAAINLLHKVPRKYTVSIELGGLSRRTESHGVIWNGVAHTG
jgi:hypothetical protein